MSGLVGYVDQRSGIVNSGGVTHYTYTDMNILANSPWVFGTTSDSYAFKFQSIVWIQLQGNDGDNKSLSNQSNYYIGTIRNNELKPSSDRTIFSPSLHYENEINGYFKISTNGDLTLYYPLERGDTVHRFGFQGFYKL